ncbi:MAG TPA: hypothetical protein VM912_16680 [Terriglobales bacterium]|nr:hypothetical protein [Terriglobales bacterium]
MPEISGKSGKTLLNVLTRAIPAHKGPDSESVTKVVQARSMAVKLTTQPDLP